MFSFSIKLSCFDVSWFNEYFLSAKDRLELVNKSYFGTAKEILSEEEYLKILPGYLSGLKEVILEC